MADPTHAENSALNGFQGRFVAELLAVRTAELADLAARELTRAHPQLAARYSPTPREKWTENYLGRIADLSSALFAESPEIFSSQVAWARAAFAARGAPVDDLRASMSALATVLRREVPPEDAALVDAYIAGAIAALDAGEGPPPGRLSAGSPHGAVAAAYLLRILEGDRMAACAVIHDALARGVSVRAAYLDILVPVQQELGRMWHLNEITVAEEHFATSTTLMVMSQLLPLAPRAPRDGRVVMAAAIDGNTHDLGVRMVADFFEIAGWRSIYLGASVPAEDLIAGVQDFRVDLVALSAALPAQIPTLERTITSIRHALGASSPKIVVGGSAFFTPAPGGREIWRGLGADGFADSADAAVTIADRLVPRARPAGSG